MKPPYDITPTIIKTISAISEKIGEVKANFLTRASPQLRKENKIKTIHSSLSIEGNTLTVEQITALLENRRVVGPQKDVLEVLNAIKVYDSLKDFKYDSGRSFLVAHKILMHGLIAEAGKYRSRQGGIVQGEKVAHLAPPPSQVPGLMKDLFKYLKTDKDLTLIKSCVFHYEVEFIHPFTDGNGRMGRLWQTLILMNDYPVFEFIPFETLISKTQEDYYMALSKSDKSGSSTAFIEYMLGVIDLSLSELLKYNNRHLTERDRLEFFMSLHLLQFTRMDYMNVFKDISSATASRDLKKGVELNLISKQGTKNKTVYRLNREEF